MVLPRQQVTLKYVVYQMDSTILFSLRLSLQVAFVATLAVIVVGVYVAYILARRDFRGKELVDIIFSLRLVLPPTVNV